MKRSRSALARHRQRKLQEATLHVSQTSELRAVAEAAGAVSLARLRPPEEQEQDEELLQQALRVLRNVKNSVYHRAMAARALGLLVLQTPELLARLALEREDLMDALLQLVNCCRRLETRNADTQRVHVNCCLVISMLMRSPAQPRLQLVVALDSELLAMPPRPVDKGSASLLLTVSGRPESAADGRSDAADFANALRVPLQPIPRSLARPPPLPSPPRDAAFPPKSNKVKAKRPPPSHDSPTKPQKAAALHRKPEPPSFVALLRDEDALPALAPAIERRQTPIRQFKMDRFRVVTPALVPSTPTGVSRTQDKPLPVIPPSRHQMERPVVEPPGSANQLESSPRTTSPAASLSPPPPSSALLRSHHMVEILRSGRMPVASANYFHARLRDDADASVRKAETPSRLQVVEWGEWRRRNLDADQERDDGRGERHEEVAVADQHTDSDRRRRPSSSASALAHRKSSANAFTASSRDAPSPSVEDIHTPEYKRERLRDILTSPIEPFEHNTEKLHALHRRESTTTMHVLGSELSALRDGEARTQQQTRSLIERERDKLPLKFLFQLPGGAAYCRDRMRRAMLLWVHEFEANQLRMALLQWKAVVEQSRFRERGQAYHRLAIEKRLRVAIEYVLRGFQQQAFRKWVETVQLAIWTDRDGAVRKIQRQVRRHFGLRRFLRWHDAYPVGGPFLRDIYLTPTRDESCCVRFRIPVRVREERRRIWFAAELVQGVYRKRRFRKFLRRYRVAAIKIQARARMRIHRAQYRLIRHRIICFQAWVRMQRHYRAYQTLRRAATLVQINFRAMRIRRMRKLVIKAQRRAVEWRLTAALLIQRVCRGFIGRCDARRRRRERDEMFHAALVVQRAWYRRNNEWSTFLLLGCLREKENEEIMFEKSVLSFKQKFMVKQIQHAWQKHLHRTRTRAAAFVQRNVRRWIATRFVERKRRELMAHRRIKWFFRFRHAHRIVTARKLQFWWLHAVPGRLFAHLRHLRLASQAAMMRHEYYRMQRASTLIQSVARGRRDRLLARKERCARVIQKAARAFIMWRRVKREIRRIKGLFAVHCAREWVDSALLRVFTAKIARLNTAATRIQCAARGYLWRGRLTRLLVDSELRARMATRIQTRWKQNAQSRLAKRVLSAQRRRRENPFRGLASISQVLRGVKARAGAHYDPSDEIQGVHVAEWLKRLGVNEEQYYPLFQKFAGDGKDVLTELRTCGGPDDCLRMLERIGVDDDDEAQLMTTNLFAAQTLRIVRGLRSKLETLRHVQREDEKRGAFAQQQLDHAQTAQQEVVEHLEEVLNEAAEFRNPPKALRDKREKLSTLLDQAQQHVAVAKAKREAIEKRAEQRKRDMRLLQNELSEREKDEVSAVFSLQNFRLVKELSVARELFLSKFPGLEARALTFVGALEQDQVSTWQLLRFFQSNLTISQVKVSMSRLTYFKYATDVKKHDHARFQTCSDIFQYGFEKIGELLAIPVDEMVLRIHGDARRDGDAFLPAMVLQTIHDTYLLRQPKERAVAWSEATQIFADMNAVATRVQSHWRRRAANRVMQLVRSNRLKAQLRDDYLAEMRADYVTPIWQEDRDREKQEHEQWLRDEERAAREEALYEVLRFPWQEDWDEDSQSWVVYRVISVASDEGESTDYEYASERPVYTIEEEDAVVRMQSLVRRFLARMELSERRRQQRREEKKRHMERQWQLKASERAQTMTLRVQVGVAADERVSLWLGHRQHQQSQKQNQASLLDGKKTKGSTTTTTASTGASSPARRRRNAVEKEDREKKLAQNAETVAAFEAQLTNAAVLQQCDASYHRSVRTDHRRHVLFPSNARPPNAHAQAMLDFLHATQTLQRALALRPYAKTSLAYTMVALPFGWREIPPASPGDRPYFYNAATQETVWERPQYDFEAEYAAVKIQSLARVALAWSEREKTLQELSFVSSVHATIQRAARVGWVGFGLEGMSAAVLLSRLGLAKYASAVASLSVEDVLRLSEAKMKKLGMTKEEMATLKTSAPPRVVRTKRTFPLTGGIISLEPTVKHAFNFLPSERVIHQIIAQSLPNQQGRVVGLVRAVTQSSTPISYRQLEMHLRLYAGRPDDAVAHIGDIASLVYATQAPQEAQILERFLRCLERCLVFAANLKLRGLHEELTLAMRVAAAMLRGPTLRDKRREGEAGEVEHDDTDRKQDDREDEDVTTSLLAARVLVSPATPLARMESSRAKVTIATAAEAARVRCAERPMKGLWEHAAAQTPLSAAQVALFVRERALERTLLWWRCAALTQATFRMHRVRTWYRAVVAHRRHCATVVQCAWRVFGAREMRRLLESQQRSPYEQHYDKLTQTFFFMYTPTREKLLDEPRDAQGAMLPYRPMVRDRLTSRWIQAWPHLQSKGTAAKTKSKDDDDDDDWARDAPRCSVCHVERAVRRCLECVAPSGDYVDSCLACFFDAHAPGSELAWHAFTPLQALRSDKPRAFHCVECKRFSTLRCLACREHYCERCFLRVHRKGHTRARHACEHYAARAPICVECEANVAFQKCLVCQDALCEPCMARTHAKGAKQGHARELLRQPLDAESGHVYCEHCDARRGDTTCSFCARSLCHVCLQDPTKHAAAACPETLLQLKKQELLGGRLCVECGKPADRACARCGDKYCSVKWMGNPGCFERFHWKGKRADHACEPLGEDAAAPRELPREILELEEQVKQKRRRDAETAEQEARAMAAALAEAAVRAEIEADAKRASERTAAKRRARRGGASKRRLLGTANARLVCGVDGCGKATLSAAVPFCSAHLTSQHALDVTKQDPLEAAKLLALVEKHGGKLPVAQASGGWRASWRGVKTAQGEGKTAAEATAPGSEKKAVSKKKKTKKKEKADGEVE